MNSLENLKKFCLFILSAIFFIGVGYGWRMAHEYNSVERAKEQQVFTSAEEKKEFNRKIKFAWT